jgi:hypothetical protein
MTVCPIALAVHCIRCPIVKLCPAKTILGDYDKYNPADEAHEKAKEGESPKGESK